MPVGGFAEDVRLDVATDKNSEDLILYKTHISILQTQGNISGNTVLSSSEVRFSKNANCLRQLQENTSCKVTFTFRRKTDWMTAKI